MSRSLTKAFGSKRSSLMKKETVAPAADEPFGYYKFEVEEQLKGHPALLKEFNASIAEGRNMKKDAANDLAQILMKWAMDRGAKNFAHWAFPMRNGAVALLKYDAFLDLDFANNMKPITAFSGSKLFFNETDGSSFPNGGLRATHTAAAYLTWDKLSPPFMRQDTLYIPAAFISWTGDALDEKTPLLRSSEAIDKAGTRLLKYLGDKKATGIVCYNGCEQEFFLIEREKFLARPDLVATGRTLFGAAPVRGQQFDNNYFARLPLKIKAIMETTQARLHALGVTMVVYHSEVAPSQYEFSPIFSMCNRATDENILCMDVLQEVANEFDMVALYHEKPFAGLNGSGKHSNWGMNERSTGRNLLVPGKNKAEQESFIALVTCLIRSVHVHGDLFRIAVASAGNDHRLGAQEAPPAIMSLYVGKGLGQHLQDICDGKASLDGYGKAEKIVEFGSSAVQTVATPVEDRNRTAPFPFCGNRFEFRAVGSEFNTGFPLTVVQTTMAESMNLMADELDKGKKLKDVVRAMLSEHIDGMFNGNGYGDEWPIEAEARGLLNLKTTPAALEIMDSDKNKELFAAMSVLKPHELEARKEVYLERYVETIVMEAKCLVEMLEKAVFSACAQDIAKYAAAPQLAGERADVYSALRSKTDALIAKIDGLPHGDDILSQAQYCNDEIKTAMASVRSVADQAEQLCDKTVWPYPTYQEICFNFQSGKV